jgi:hypothetical protein
MATNSQEPKISHPGVEEPGRNPPSRREATGKSVGRVALSLCSLR